MNNTFIWDLDGTLLNSYPAIVRCLVDAYAEHGVKTNPQEVYHFITMDSSVGFMRKMEAETGASAEEIRARYKELSLQRTDEISEMTNAVRALEMLKAQGARHFCYTHRGQTSFPVLKRLGLIDFFEEIITGEHGFARKPDPEAVLYLMNKYSLPKESTFYVGDRNLDIECAQNANIRGILFLPPDRANQPCPYDCFRVFDLTEIASLPLSAAFPQKG